MVFLTLSVLLKIIWELPFESRVSTYSGVGSFMVTRPENVDLYR